MPWMGRGRCSSVAVIVSSVLVAASDACAAAAPSVGDFYAGKVITFVVGALASGGYDLLLRVFAAHMGKHIPGNPTLIVSNMPTGAGIAAANYLGQVAPHDGTFLSIIDQYLPQAQAPGAPSERVAALRRAFDETVKDPDFAADVNRQRLEVQPLSGDSVDRLMRDLIGAPQDVRDRAKAFTASAG